MKKLLLIIACAMPLVAAAQRTPVVESNYAAAQRFTSAKVRQMIYPIPVDAKWLEHSNRFWYSYKTSEGTKWWLVDADRGTKRPLFDNHYMASEIARITKDPYDIQNIPITNIRFTADEKAFRFSVTSKIEEVENPDTKKKEKKRFTFEYNLSTKRLTVLEDHKPTRIPNWGNISPDGQTIVYSKNYDLWMMDRENFDKLIENSKDSTVVETRITFDGVRGFGFGDATVTSTDKIDTVMRRRIDVLWSPDSRRFAYTMKDTRAVEEMWIINNIARPRPTLQTYPYQMPGEKEVSQFFLYLVDVAAKERQYVEVGAFKDQIVGLMEGKPVRKRFDDYTLESKVWMGGNDSFIFERMSRDARRLDFCRVDVETLDVKAIIEERSNFYLEDRPITLTDGPGSDIVHWSEENGWAHLYLYSWEGERIRQLTDGPWHVERVVDVDPRTKTIYFTANGREEGIDPNYTFFYRINFDGTGLRLLTPGDYSHSIRMSENRRYFVDNVSRIDDVPYSVLRNADGREVMELEKADLSRLFETGYKFPERFKVKAADGVTDLYGTLYLPYNLDSTKLYPVIEYVYPGPQEEGVQHMFHWPALTLDRLAQLGFVVMTVGNRGGAPHRSKWYHTFGSGNLRDYGLADKKTAAIQLADRYPFMDISRVGITGHSGGGFMSTAAILKYPDFFKVAVSRAGNHDNAIYNRGWGETHQGVKEEISAKGDTTFTFKVDNNQQIAGNLQGRLLLVTGDVDNNVHPANTILVVDALIRAGKRFDMLVLPGQAHQFGDMSEYFFWRMADYFSMWLMGDRRERPVDIPELRE